MGEEGGAASNPAPATGSGDGIDGGGTVPTNDDGGALTDGANLADAGAPPTSVLPTAFTKRLLSQVTYPNARCNDGSAAGYYPAAGSPGAKDFVIFLDGGSWCSSDADCASRSKDLSSSSGWPATQAPTGLLSSDRVNNPHFAGLNRIYVPYCTSDLFSGNAPASAPGKFEFRGRAVLDAVIADAKATYGLGASGSSVLFAGASAGGVSVLVAADRVAAALPGVKVTALVDAGFLPDVAPLMGPSILAQFSTAIAYWQGQPDDSCAAANPGNPNKCYLAQYAQPEISTPLFFGQNLEDPHGPLHAGGFTWPAAPNAAQISWMNNVYTPAMLKLLPATSATTGYYSPCQVVHTMVDTSAWYMQTIGAEHYDDAVSSFVDRSSPTRLASAPCTYK